MADLLKELAETAEYFQGSSGQGGGDIIGTHACALAIEEIKKLRAKIRRDEAKLREIAYCLDMPPYVNRLDWLLEQARRIKSKEGES